MNVRFALALIPLVLACDPGPTTPSTSQPSKAPAVEAAPSGDLPAGHPDISGVKAPGAAPGAAATAGTVEETMSAGGYTYVKVKTGDKSVWAAGPMTEVAVGDSVKLPDGAMMADFHSPSLDRTFPSILFVGAIEVGK